MKKIKVMDIDEDGYHYTLSDGKNIYRKNMEFYSKNKPKKGDTLYIEEKILEENNILSFTDLYEDKMLRNYDIIKVISKDKEYYLQREYG